jgi:CysZ protein
VIIFNKNKFLVNPHPSQIKISLLAYPKGVAYILKNKWVIKYIALAVFLNILTFIALIAFSFWISSSFSDFILSVFTDNQNGVLSGLQFLLGLIFWMISIFVFIQLFAAISSIVNAPVYSVLTSKVIEKEFPEVDFPKSSIFTEIWLALLFEIKKLSISFSFLIFSLILNLIPFVGSVVFFILNLFQLLLLSGLDVFEPYHSLNRFRFRRRIAEVISRPLLYSPFLLICGFIASIPILNIFLIPVSIVSATQFVKVKKRQIEILG